MCTHFFAFERADGNRIVSSQALLDVIGTSDPTWNDDAKIHHLAGTVADVRWATGSATLPGRDAADAPPRR